MSCEKPDFFAYAENEGADQLHGKIAQLSSAIFSSPEPLGSQGELIVYPSSRRPSVRRRKQFQTSSSPKPLG